MYRLLRTNCHSLPKQQRNAHRSAVRGHLTSITLALEVWIMTVAEEPLREADGCQTLVSFAPGPQRQ